MVDFSKLPIELINIIVNYTDIVVYRHGKYLNRIKKDDERYNIFQQITRPINVGKFKQVFNFIFCNEIQRKYLSFEQKFNPESKRHFLIEKKCYKTHDGLLIVEFETKYIFDLQGKYNKLVNYIM